MFSIEVCHIFAYSLGSSAALLTPSPSFQVTKPNLWLLLHLLAGPTTTALVESYLLSNHVRSQNPSGPGTSINRLENLMTFSANVHQYWAKCLFTLTPIGDPLTFPPPLTAYDCIFKWMPGYTRAALDLTQVLDPGTPLSEQDDPDLQKASIPDFRSRQARHGGEVVMLRKSGDIITLRTIDPEGMPLPHPDLLRLQAALAEVVRCAGAASEEAEFEDDEDSLDNWDVGENNQENEEFEVEFKVVNDDLESGHEVDARGQQRAVKQIPYLLKRFLDSMDGNPDNGSSNLEAV
ncbi:hypothetical protein BDZ91DRAFT_267226 [Kalaharituber pfeilii]|nr:hypothetical protein BDZ91DRAFT_267226 [Kalaharituber pfeilii]